MGSNNSRVPDTELKRMIDCIASEDDKKRMREFVTSRSDDQLLITSSHGLLRIDGGVYGRLSCGCDRCADIMRFEKEHERDIVDHVLTRHSVENLIDYL